VSAEFRALSSKQSSPVTRWLRSLARFAHGECGGLGVGAIGMCFTGNFALTMMLEPSMLAPVLSQPSLPLNDPAGIGAGMAMESATVLAHLLRDVSRDGVVEALRAYERAQRPRVEAAQDNSRQLAKLMFRQSSFLAVLRDLAVRLLPLKTAIRPIRKLLDESPLSS
jgi:dienelactone hydrolase